MHLTDKKKIITTSLWISRQYFLLTFFSEFATAICDSLVTNTALEMNTEHLTTPLVFTSFVNMSESLQEGVISGVKLRVLKLSWVGMEMCCDVHFYMNV